jgi:predicted esterase
MQKHQFIVPKTARYFTLGELSENTENVWFVIHGYGQLAEFFIKKFKILDDGKTFIIAPEALSKFYLKDFSGRVGATWMTREDRENEITDYINYLNLLHDTVFQNTDVNKLKINILGFSQGTATVARWCMNEHIRYDRLVLWAGYFGNGIQDVINPEKVLDKEVILCYGKEDEFLKQIDIQQYENDVRAVIPHGQIHTFEGGHTIEEADLLFVVRCSMLDVRTE